jgi:hypothetical protein
MSLLALEINDAMLHAAVDSRGVAAEPGFALVGEDGAVTAGMAALAQARLQPRRIVSDYWHRLDLEPAGPAASLTRADLASEQLEALLRRDAGDVAAIACAVPPTMGRDGLGVLLGVIQDLGLQVTALVDSSVAATRSHYRDRTLLHLDLGLHATWVSRLRQSETVTLDDYRLIDGVGLASMYDAWLRWFAAQFVQQCRFDPLHSAQSEQAMFERLPRWLAEVDRGQTLSLALPVGETRQTIEVEAPDVINVVSEAYQRIAETARALLAAGEVPALQLTDNIARLPGLAATLQARVGGEYHVLAPGAAALGLSERQRSLGGSEATRLLRSLAPDLGEVLPGTERASDYAVPTHVLVHNTAYPLGAVPLSVGASAAGEQRPLVLTGELAGISALHCRLAVDNGECIVTDLSRFGTFLNGHRISGSARLQVGDSLRVGTPGQELGLIRVAEASDAA